MATKRIIWSVYAAGLAPESSTSYTTIKGLQSFGLTTTFNLEQVFEIGQLAIYENIEDIPDVEVTLEKVLDGEHLMLHLATQGAGTGATLAARSNQACEFYTSIYDDNNDSASGTPLVGLHASGMFLSSVGYTLPVDGNCTESVTLVGNNITWTSSPTMTGTLFNNSDTPASGVQRRQDVVMGGSIVKFPLDIPGISSSDTNDKVNSDFNVHFQNISINADLGREAINELGRKGAYFRPVTFPVEVTSEFELIFLGNSNSGINTRVNALEDADNLTDQEIVIALADTTKFNLGTNNKLASVTYGNGDAGGGNMTETYSYTTFNDLTVSAPGDPG